jgi:hypothetical protein
LAGTGASGTAPRRNLPDKPAITAGNILKMPDQDQAELRLQFARLKQEHADFDAAIEAMAKVGCEPLQIQRMKKKKLALRDLMQKIEDQIIPDIIA